MRWVLLVVVIGGCGRSAASHATANEPGAPGESLAAALTREVGAGRSVAIVAGTDGIRAISSDGVRQRPLADGGAAWAIVDHRSNVVWFGSTDTAEIRAIDLEAPADRPIEVHTVATGLPEGNRVAMVGPPRYEVYYPNLEPGISEGEAVATGEQFATASVDLMRASVALTVAAEPSVSGDSGYLRDEEWEGEIAGATIRDRAFVAGLVGRADHRVPAPASPAETRVDGVDPGGCDEPADCGRAQPIGGTRYWRVMTGNVMGDVRHVHWQLYDPDAKRMIDGEWASWLEDAWVAPDHAAFLSSGIVVRFDGGPVAATPPDAAGLGGGWLGGGTFYGRFY